ncbi:MAG: hypothetical protein AB8I08_19680 [Sandaracinaceae bacterium]
MLNRRAPLFLTLLCALSAPALHACEVGERGGGDSGTGDGGNVVVVRCDGTMDTDGDGLYDEIETSQDFDNDGIPNFQDTDSDNDGILDAEEHGTSEGCSARDTDGDGLADFIDLDADGDGLSDQEERERYFTDPFNPDSDGDGFIDVAEVATMNDPNDPESRIPDETFFVVLPYMGDAEERELVFGTTIQKADVFFMMDRTGSMNEEVSNLESSLSGIVAEMTTSLSDVGVGFGAFAGFGGPGAGGCTTILGIMSCSDGEDGDMPFEIVQTITTDLPTMQTGVGTLADIDYGGANWASSTPALYLTATGEGFQPWLGPQNCPAIPDEMRRRYGYPCFRPGALPIMVVLTDTASKNGPGASTNYDPSTFMMSERGPHTYEESRDAVNAIGGRVIGIISGAEAGNPTGQFNTWATDTGTVDASGAPIVFNISSNGSGLDSRVIEAIRTLSEETPQDISGAVVDGEDVPAEVGPVDAGMFVKSITPTSIIEGGVPTDCPSAGVCDDRVFDQVTPGATVRFRIRFLNDFQTPRSFAQVFLAEIVVLGNGVAELDSREVVIVVPAGSTFELI